MKKINEKKYIEKYIKIKNKKGEIIHFKLNEPQTKLYEVIQKQKKEGKPVRIIILKARQMGFSTLTEAVLFTSTVTNFNINSGIITHSVDATNNLFNMSKRMYDNLPKELKPNQQACNSKELIFDNKIGLGLGSKIKCMTAGSKGAGRSDTINKLHISEYAFWEGDKKQTLTGLLQAVPNDKDSMVIIESTANGYDHFKELWDLAVEGKSDFYPLFVGWNELKTYQKEYDGFELTDEEKILKENYNLTNEQLSWRRWSIRNNCSNDIREFRQEYPINPEEAFLTTGNCFFDKELIFARLNNIPKAFKRGYFTYSETNYVISNIKWVNDKNGYIKVYDTPRSTYKYGIGGDTAGDGIDNYTAQVVNANTMKQVATFCGKLDSDLYARQMYCLGKYYEYALIGIESNFDSHPIKELESLGYKNMYFREREDTFTKTIIKSYGFQTNRRTRPIILDNLKAISRDAIELINDKQTLNEMIVFIINEKGRPEAMKNKHDDLVMALAIAYRILDQIDLTTQPIISQRRFGFNIERPLNEDYGEDIVVI